MNYSELHLQTPTILRMYNSNNRVHVIWDIICIRLNGILQGVKRLNDEIGYDINTESEGQRCFVGMRWIRKWIIAVRKFQKI